MMIMGISEVCSRLVQALGVSSVSRSSSGCQVQVDPNPIKNIKSENNKVDELMIRALTGVFGMQNNGKINKENARQVVEKLGLIYTQEEEEDEMAAVEVEEVLSGLEQDRRHLLVEAFKIFDEDGNGYIEAVELKRVLQCLSLDKGWDITDIQNMLKVFDLNLDGKVDFTEFELMMMT